MVIIFHNGKKSSFIRSSFVGQMKCAILIAYVSKGGFRYFCLDKEGDKHITGYSFESFADRCTRLPGRCRP